MNDIYILFAFVLVDCKKGYFGRNCAHECSPNCNLDTCQNTDGWCVCADGLPADNCTIGNFDRLKYIFIKIQKVWKN